MRNRILMEKTLNLWIVMVLFDVSPINLTGGSILIPSFPRYAIFFCQPALITRYILYLLPLQRQDVLILQTV